MGLAPLRMDALYSAVELASIAYKERALSDLQT